MNYVRIILFTCILTFGTVALFTEIYPPEPCDLSNITQASISTTVNSYIGILLAIFGSIINSVGLLIEKIAHGKTTNHYTSILWWEGFGLITFAEILNGIAYGYTSATVISSLGSLTLVINVFLAVCVLGENVTIVKSLGILCILIGVLLLFISTPETSKVYTQNMLRNLYTSWDTIIYASFCMLSIIVLTLWKTEKYNLYRLAAYAAIVSSWTVVCVKGILSLTLNIVDDCHYCGCSQSLRSWLFWVLILGTILTAWWGGGMIEQQGLKLYPQILWLPVHFCYCTIFFSLSGMIVYGEWDDFSNKSTPVIIMGLFMCSWGVVTTSLNIRMS